MVCRTVTQWNKWHNKIKKIFPCDLKVSNCSLLTKFLVAKKKVAEHVTVLLAFPNSEELVNATNCGLVYEQDAKGQLSIERFTKHRETKANETRVCFYLMEGALSFTFTSLPI